MKKNIFMGVIAMGALLVVFAGISHAGGWMHQSSGETESIKQGSNTPALEPWSYEYWQAQEAGTLPGTGVKSESSESDMALARAAESEPKEQIGVFEFREIDKGE
jgi:hypothetical protein